MDFYIEQAILERAPRTRLAVVELDGMSVGFGHENLDEMRLRVANRIRDELRSSTALKSVPQIAGTQELLGRFDPDMRRTVTATEVLLRKVIEGGNLPVENDALDAAALLAIYYKLPVMISDVRDLRGPAGLVVGREGRPFDVLQGHDPIRVQGRLFLKDDIGYFASPIAPCKRALVTERTKRALLTCIFPENVGDSILNDFIRRGGNWLTSLCGGEVIVEGLVGEAETAE